jgi:hypothetical protein
LDSWDLNQPVKKQFNANTYFRFDSNIEQKIDLFLRKGQIKNFLPGGEDLTYIDVQEPKVTRVKDVPAVTVYIRSDTILETLEAEKHGITSFLSVFGGFYTSINTICSLLCYYFGRSLYRFYLIDTLFWRAKSQDTKSDELNAFIE